jgi:hypothetical protein
MYKFKLISNASSLIYYYSFCPFFLELVMIDNINSNNTMSPAQMQRINFSMSDQQRTAATEIISKYDPQKMTDDDNSQMREELRAEGIKPGEDLNNLLTQAGFRAGNNQRPETQSPSPNVNMSNELQNTINGFAEKFREGNATNDDLDQLLEMLYQNGRPSQGNLFDGVS